MRLGDFGEIGFVKKKIQFHDDAGSKSRDTMDIVAVKRKIKNQLTSFVWRGGEGRREV